MTESLKRAVRLRARNRCEYCRLPQRLNAHTFHIEHVIAQQHDGPTSAENLALACPGCNFHKGPNLSGIDPVGNVVVVLFNPRLQGWAEHFRFELALVVGLTPTGRATVKVFDMNNAMAVDVRSRMIAAGLFHDE